jgi:ribosomal protein S18
MSHIPRHFSRSLASHVKSKCRALPSADGGLSNLVASQLSIRPFSTGDGDDGKSHKSKSNPQEDPFGVHFEDSSSEASGNIGPKDSLPPNYIRDSATGKFTGQIQTEATAQEKRLLNLDPMAKDRMLTEKFEELLQNDDVMEKDESAYSMANVARRIREEKIALNTLGRKVTDVEEALEHGDYDDLDDDDREYASSAPLSADELESLHKFMQNTSSDEITENLLQETEDLLPTTARKSTSKSPASEPDSNNPDLDFEWMTAAAQRTMANTDMDVEDLDDPFSNLMPSDLNPAKKVNRRRARPIPKELLQHNNLSLLRRYVTPGGQIMNRVQSRLGAKDQRKIAKLVKRARHLGLIPVIGQWKFEDHGNVKDPSIFEDTEWEKRLMERGLVERKSKMWNRPVEKRSSTW